MLQKHNTILSYYEIFTDSFVDLQSMHGGLGAEPPAAGGVNKLAAGAAEILPLEIWARRHEALLKI